MAEDDTEEQETPETSEAEASGEPEAPEEDALVEKIREQLLAKADTVPGRPGIYLFKDARGKVIYDGKAKSLRDRLRAYLNLSDGRYQIQFLMTRAADFETLVTTSETEALIL